MNRRVKSVRFQTNVYYQNVGELGNTLPSPNKRLDNLTMTAHGADGLVIKFLYEGTPREVWVPGANISMAVLEPELDKKDS